MIAHSALLSVQQIIAFKPDIVITEKGVSDLAQHYFLKAGITAFRRLRKTDNNRVAKATGATIVNRPDEIQESDIGIGCGLFEVRKIGDEYVTCMLMPLVVVDLTIMLTSSVD
jgi:T-complex protein 1 subunit gamma